MRRNGGNNNNKKRNSKERNHSSQAVKFLVSLDLWRLILQLKVITMIVYKVESLPYLVTEEVF